ncbi:Homeodomain-like [Phytophthora cactorum]|nr:Homeodomain-like [Phytophthora cactorum]
MDPSGVDGSASKPDSIASAEPNRGSGNNSTPAGKPKRKTKRLLWTEELHLRFVSAVFELGVKNASPKALLAIQERKLAGMLEVSVSHLQVPLLPIDAQQRPSNKTQTSNGAYAMHYYSKRMDFHRELLLTRSVEVESGLSWANRMSNTGMTANGSYNEQHESSFLQAWANAEQLRQQQEQVYGRLHEQQQSVFHQTQDAAPVAPVFMGGSKPEPPPRTNDENMDTDGGVDLTSWGRLSLTAESDDDDVFGFLRS